jgi:hypothetical protein
MFSSVGAADQGVNITGSQLGASHAAAAAADTSPAGNGSPFAFSSNKEAIGDYCESLVAPLSDEEQEHQRNEEKAMHAAGNRHRHGRLGEVLERHRHTDENECRDDLNEGEAAR